MAQASLDKDQRRSFRDEAIRGLNSIATEERQKQKKKKHKKKKKTKGSMKQERERARERGTLHLGSLPDPPL